MIGPEAPVLALIAGAVLLIAGRRLFWLFVGLVGFFTVYRWFEPYSGAGPNLRWAIAILAGLAGIVLAIFLQRVAIAVAGFLVGGWFMAGVLGFQFAHARGMDLLLVLVAGVVAAFLALLAFDVALVVLSSLAGAQLIVEALHFDRGVARLLVVVLLVVGVAIQMGFTARRRRA
jgi:hypothetical protein